MHFPKRFTSSKAAAVEKSAAEDSLFSNELKCQLPTQDDDDHVDIVIETNENQKRNGSNVIVISHQNDDSIANRDLQSIGSASPITKPMPDQSIQVDDSQTMSEDSSNHVGKYIASNTMTSGRDNNQVSSPKRREESFH